MDSKYFIWFCDFIAICIGFIGCVLLTIAPLFAGIGAIILSILYWNEEQTIGSLTEYQWLFGVGLDLLLFFLLNICLPPLIYFMSKHKNSKILDMLAIIYLIFIAIFILYSLIWWFFGIIIASNASDYVQHIATIYIVVGVLMIGVQCMYPFFIIVLLFPSLNLED